MWKPTPMTPEPEDDGSTAEILTTLKVASQIVDAIRFDGDMNYPMAGNGGLLSEGTIRKADDLHKLLIKIGIRTE